ncbi:MAG: hypothetical protein NW241_07700 [Bacteroidia bacterium]|nr:hypothetical protein [Bacteroidia bacterium]
MLILALTRKKVLAGVRTNGHELTPLELPGAADGSQPLSRQIAAAVESARAALAEEPGPLPVAVAFAPGISGEKTDAADLNYVSRLIESSEDGASTLLFAEPLTRSLVRGLAADPEMEAEGWLVLDALDGEVSLCYRNIAPARLNGSIHGGEAIPYTRMPDLSPEGILRSVLDEAAEQLRRSGLQPDEHERMLLQQQLAGHCRPGSGAFTLDLRRTQGPVRIHARIDMPEGSYERAVIRRAQDLRPYLDKTKLDGMGVRHVLLAGDFFARPAVSEFFGRELGLADLLPEAGICTDEACGRQILQALSQTAAEVLRAREEADRRRREEEARRQAIEKELRIKTERDQVLRDIQLLCTDPARRSEYEAMFVPRGAAAEMPREIILWNIDEVLRQHQLQMSSSPVAPFVPVTPPAAAAVPPAAVPAAQPAAAPPAPQLPSLQQLFEVKGVLLDREFSTKKVQPADNPQQIRVMRLLDAATADADRFARFERLYQKELTYYQELSDIHEAAEGKYYLRDYIPRNTLKDYAKKTSLEKKPALDKLSSKEVALILQVFEEVRNLPVSHANLNEFNILILQEGLIRKNMNIRFVGFTSEDASPDEMEMKLHTMFANLIGARVYEQLRQKLNF